MGWFRFPLCAQFGHFLGDYYDGSRVLVDSVSSATAQRSVAVSSAPTASPTLYGYAPSQASLTVAEFDASLKEQYWALDPDNGVAEPVTAVFKDAANPDAYPRQFPHFFSEKAWK
jgi:hypothetical protein